LYYAYTNVEEKKIRITHCIVAIFFMFSFFCEFEREARLDMYNNDKREMLRNIFVLVRSFALFLFHRLFDIYSVDTDYPQREIIIIIIIIKRGINNKNSLAIKQCHHHRSDYIDSIQRYTRQD